MDLCLHRPTAGMDDRGASLTQTERAHLPRYFFNVEDDRTIIDQEGTDLPNLRAAREEAVSTSAELLRERAGGFPLERKTLGDVGYGPSWRNGRNATQAPVFCDRRRGRGHYQRGTERCPLPSMTRFVTISKIICTRLLPSPWVSAGSSEGRTAPSNSWVYPCGSLRR
jgi:hypothetical protein